MFEKSLPSLSEGIFVYWLRNYEMSTKIRKLITLIALVSLMTPVLSAAYNQASAISYLKSTALDDWSVMALASSGALDGVDLSFLSQDPGRRATDMEKRILARAAAGLDDNGLADKLTAQFDGTEFGAGQKLLNDDIFGLLSLAARSKAPRVRNKLTGFIKQNQNPDGGFGFAHSPAASDSNDTAMAIMALLAAGEDKNSEIINKAFAFINTTKTATGYSFSTDFGPDTASTAWVVSALTAARRSVPEEARGYLISQQLSDGSFAWQDRAGASPLMTAYAVIALNRDFYPVRAANPPPPPPAQASFAVTIQGPDGILFSGNLSFDPPTAINAVVRSGLPHVIAQTSLGLFVESIAGIGPEGSKGWMYAVNGVKPNIGAAEYVLRDGDRALWFYGEAGDSPPSQENPAESATRQAVSLTAEILPPPSPLSKGEGTKIIFGVSVSEVDFGKLTAGQTSEARTVSLINRGEVDLEITTSLENADQLYERGVMIDDNAWAAFKRQLSANFRRPATLKLQVPASYDSTGRKTGTLIFWAKAK